MELKLCKKHDEKIIKVVEIEGKEFQIIECGKCHTLRRQEV